VRAIPKPEDPGTATADDELGAVAMAELMANPSLIALDAGRADWSAEIAGLPALLAAGRSEVHTDSPVRDAATHNHMPDAIRALMRSARGELLITNAYIIPDANFMADLRELGGRGVRVRILTNSLSSHDVPAVNSHYGPTRGAILATGAELFELRADATLRSSIVDLPPLTAGFVGLHTKAMVIDRERAFVGSMNLDPRSEVINSEMGVIIDSPQLAANLAQRMELDMAGENAWQVVAAADGSLRWRSAAGELDRQPARNFMQRVEDFVFKFFPSSLY
jgi:putative cardiolipin synthase